MVLDVTGEPHIEPILTTHASMEAKQLHLKADDW